MERRIVKHSNWLLLLFGFLIISCGGNIQEEEIKDLRLERYAFERLLQKEENPQLIDVRTAAEFQEGSISGAINKDFLDGTFEQYLSQLDKNRKVFVFCAKGGRSRKAADLLRKNGFSSIIDLEGGYTAWLKQAPK